MSEGEEGDIHQETALDSEVAHEVAPKAHETYWLAADEENSFGLSLQTAQDEAANSSAKVISNSWYQDFACPTTQEPRAEFEEGNIYEMAAAQGKTFFFSSGDQSASSQFGCSYPASSAYVVAVGGTSLFSALNSSAWEGETADGEDNGNCYRAIPRPSWQTGIGNPNVLAWSPTGHLTMYPCPASRAYPDVSADSCELSFIWECGAIIGLESWYNNFGGTSLAAPLWAAATTAWNGENAAAGRPGVGFMAPLLYALGNDRSPTPATSTTSRRGQTASPPVQGGRGHRLGFGDLREPLEQRSRTHVHGALVILARAARVGAGAPGRERQLAGLERAVGAVLLRGGEVRSGDGSAGNAACSLRPTAAGKLTARMPADAAYVEAKAEVSFSVASEAPVAYVANYTGGSVTPIEIATNKAGAEIKVGSDPHSVAITPNGKTAYVSDLGSDAVTPITLATGKAGSEIEVGELPEGIAITPNGKTVYVANHLYNTVTPIEVATNKAGTEINVGSDPAGVAITPDGKTVYVANEGSNTVTRSKWPPAKRARRSKSVPNRTAWR